MLQPAATSSQSSLSLAVAAQGGVTESPEIPEGFAALLALGVPAGGETVIDPDALLAATTAALRQGGKPAGNASGKVLPDVLPESETVAAPGDPTTPVEGSDGLPLQNETPAEPTLAMLAVALPLPNASANAPQTTAETKADQPKQAATAPAKATEQRAVRAELKLNAASLMLDPDASKPQQEAKPATVPAVAGRATTPVAALQTTPIELASNEASKAPQPEMHEAMAAAAGARGKKAGNDANEVAPARNVSLSSDLAVGDIAKPIAAAELQPVLAMREAQSAMQGSVNVPVPTSAASAQQDGHDFAALVDRLVEARDAAMPQAVRAAIHHADFGQVTLNFQADDTRLSVSMTSTDPDFAPTVQAAAAMQANSSADNGSNNQRQDANQQQTQQNSASSTSSQSQAQSQGSARGGERERTDPSRQSGSNDPARLKDEQRPDGRGGIYA